MLVLALHSFVYHVPRPIDGKIQMSKRTFRGAEVMCPIEDQVIVFGGDTAEVPDDLAAILVANGQAENLDAPVKRGPVRVGKARDADAAALA